MKKSEQQALAKARSRTRPQFTSAGSLIQRPRPAAPAAPPAVTTPTIVQKLELEKMASAELTGELKKAIAERDEAVSQTAAALRLPMVRRIALEKRRADRVHELEASLAFYKKQPERTVSKLTRNADGTHTVVTSKWRGPHHDGNDEEE
jgi:hypothetical protein